MNICSLGRGFSNSGISQIDFNTSRTILEFDAVLIDSNGLFQHGQINDAIVFRVAEFSEFLALGRTIVVFTASLNLEIILPIGALGQKPISGNRVDFKGPDYLKVFWESVQQDMQFLAYFEKPPGKPFLFVPATDKAVATLAKVGPGNLLILPWFKIPGGPPSIYQEQCSRFMTAFRKLNEKLSPKKAIVEFPSWCKDYSWERERGLRDALTSLRKQSEQLSKAIAETSSNLDAEENLKALFTLKGDALLEVVIEAFRSLGVKAERGEPGRDDIIIEFDGKPAVVEVKGKKKSAAEEDAAQLEKWVAGFKADKGVDPKGILFINAYCETPLVERTEPAFPHQMLKYSTQREHCLITTTQLLGLLLEARAYPEKRVDLVNGLFSTVGVYQRFLDWQKFLTAPAPAPAKSK
jgi:CRISPR/Cas system-associated exonuclease Cas4 (RecB family)